MDPASLKLKSAHNGAIRGSKGVNTLGSLPATTCESNGASKEISPLVETYIEVIVITHTYIRCM